MTTKLLATGMSKELINQMWLLQRMEGICIGFFCGDFLFIAMMKSIAMVKSIHSDDEIHPYLCILSSTPPVVTLAGHTVDKVLHHLGWLWNKTGKLMVGYSTDQLVGHYWDETSQMKTRSRKSENKTAPKKATTTAVGAAKMITGSLTVHRWFYSTPVVLNYTD